MNPYISAPKNLLYFSLLYPSFLTIDKVASKLRINNVIMIHDTNESGQAFKENINE